MLKPSLIFLCLAGAISLAAGNLRPVSPLELKSRLGVQLSRNHHVFQEDVQTDEDSYDVFYDQLADDGQWYYDDTYGYVFQPAVAESSSDWRPYSDGHWDDTDRGWYWDSNERFGWATYHYGRWVLIDGEGWVWVPGNEWAPAWVSWRDSDDYCGWAPLPPDCGSVSVGISIGGWSDSYWGIGPSWYTFLPWHAWHSHSYVGAFAPFSQNVAIINKTRNVTNIYNNNNVINNFGPQAQQVALKTNRAVTKYNVNYIAQNDPRAFKATKNANQLSVIGPKPTLKPVATKPPNASKTLTGAKVDKGWKSVNPTQAASLKNKLAQQNPVPGNLPKATNALAKPTILGTKATGGNRGTAVNTPGGNKGADNNGIASNKGAGNGALANPNNPNEGGTNNKGVGSNNPKDLKGAANPSNNKGAKGPGGNNTTTGGNDTTNKGAGSNNLKAFKGTANGPNTKRANGTGGGNSVVAGNKGAGSTQLKSFKNGSSGHKGAQGTAGGSYTPPKTLKRTTTGDSTNHSTSHPKTTYQPKPTSQPKTTYRAASTYHPQANTYHPPARTYHPPAATHAPAPAYHPSGGGGGNKGGAGNKGGGGGGNKKDEKKK
jgi:uncharacterized protein DUF6600